MKRQIKFRAKAINDDFFKGVWIDGYYAKILCNGKLVDVITDGAHEIPIQIDTLGQFTGLLDKNGKEIYEGDILSPTIKNMLVEVWYSEHTATFIGEIIKPENQMVDMLYLFEPSTMDIVGNVYDNLEELLKGEIK